MNTDDDLSDLEDYRPRNPWPARIGAVFVLALGTCGVGGWLALREPPTDPHRMLVAVTVDLQEGDDATWWSSERHTAQTRTANQLHDAMAKGLEAIDLEVVSRETPRALEALGGGRDLRATAAELGAAWLLKGAVTQGSAAPIAETEWFEYTFEANLELVPTTGRGESVPLPTPVRFRSRGRSEIEAVSRITDDIAKLATPPALDVLSDQPRLQHYADPEGLSVEEQIVADQLRRFFRYASDRRAALKAHEEREAQGADIERSWGVDPETRIGPWLGWEILIGPAAGGRILLKVDELRPELPITERTVELVEVHETIVSAAPDGTDRKRLFDAYNFYGWPTVSRDGKWALGVLDERGMALTIVRVDTETGESRVLRSHDEHYYGTPVMSPDDSEVAYWWQPCRGCTAELRVLPIETLHPRTIFHNVEGSIGTPSWSPDGATVYTSVIPPGRPGSVWAVDAESGEKTLLAGPGDGQTGDSFSHAQVSPDGRYVAAVERDRRGDRHLTVIHLDDGRRERVFHGAVDGLAISPDGKRIGFQFTPEDSWHKEIGWLDPDTGAMEQLTHSDGRTDYVGGWSADSQTLYTMQEERGETQFYRVYRHEL